MAATPAKSAPPNPRLARVLREAGWIVLLAAGLYLALALGTYDRGDPGPFFSGSGAPVTNRAGAAGAWLAHAMPAARQVTITGAAHAPFLSHRSAFDAAVLPFLDGQ